MAEAFAPGDREIVGILPAGGRGTRVAPLPLSKEVYPVGFRAVAKGTSHRPKVVCHYLLEKMRLAGARQAYVVLREGKWDIPAYLGDGSLVDMNLAYLMMNLPYGPPYTVDQAYFFVREATILFGFPDVLFQPDDAFIQLLATQQKTGADVVLGLFPTDRPQKVDMVDLSSDGRVRQIVIKPARTDLRYAWMIAAWSPKFTRFMHEHLLDIQAGDPEQARRELHVGHVVQAAIDRGMPVESVIFAGGSCLDIGTPEDLMRAVQQLGRPE
jgi:glucose-1-phosphate thymidylyltransferase